MKKPFLIAVSGGSGSGKTTVVQLLEKACSDEQMLVLSQDHYYKDLSHLSEKERELYNFDHPDAIDSELLHQHLQDLVQGHSIQRPVYDFETHTRLSGQSIRIDPKPTIVLDGIFTLVFEKIRAMTQLRIFVEVGDDLRFIRRLQRDLKERGRTVENVIHQYGTTVRPMHMQHIEPTKRFADLVIFWEDYNFHSVDMIASLIKQYHRNQS